MNGLIHLKWTGYKFFDMKRIDFCTLLKQKQKQEIQLIIKLIERNIIFDSFWEYKIEWNNNMNCNEMSE